MKIIILASGSKGNATYIETKETKILIDAGISCHRLTTLLIENNINIDKLDAILVTHEHTDHVLHLPNISKKYKAKVFISQDSFEHLPKNILTQMSLNNTFFINVEKRYVLNDLTFVPIQMYHDTKNTYGYLIKAENNNIAYITDTGHVLPKYYALLKQMNILILESNHDVEMLLNSNRDYRLKQRILSNRGHLSNVECSEILSAVISENTQYVVLAHLSEECNTKEIATETALKTIKKTKFQPQLIIAEQHKATLITIGEACA